MLQFLEGLGVANIVHAVQLATEFKKLKKSFIRFYSFGDKFTSPTQYFEFGDKNVYMDVLQKRLEV